MRFKKIQQQVARYYRAGEFRAAVDDTNNLNEVGDTLFKFAVLEAGDAADIPEFIQMMNTAVDDLIALKQSFEKELKPLHCPRCGGSYKLTAVSIWTARSNEDSDNTTELTEYQCASCANESFWV